jgi:hypothetical protein
LALLKSLYHATLLTTGKPFPRVNHPGITISEWFMDSADYDFGHYFDKYKTMCETGFSPLITNYIEFVDEKKEGRKFCDAVSLKYI